jgi:hypothetical protein
VTESAGNDAALTVAGHFTVPLRDVRRAWSATLPEALA